LLGQPVYQGADRAAVGQVAQGAQVLPHQRKATRGGGLDPAVDVVDAHAILVGDGRLVGGRSRRHDRDPVPQRRVGAGHGTVVDGDPTVVGRIPLVYQ